MRHHGDVADVLVVRRGGIGRRRGEGCILSLGLRRRRGWRRRGRRRGPIAAASAQPNAPGEPSGAGELGSDAAAGGRGRRTGGTGAAHSTMIVVVVVIGGRRRRRRPIVFVGCRWGRRWGRDAVVVVVVHGVIPAWLLIMITGPLQHRGGHHGDVADILVIHD